MANEVVITVTGQDRTGSVFARVRQGLRDTLDRARDDADRSGRSIGSSLMSNVARSIMDGAGRARDAFAGVFTGALQGAASTPVIGPVIGIAVAAIAALVAPALAAAISGAMVLGMGAGLVGVGAMLLMENAKVKKGFENTFKEIKGTLTDAFEPLIPVLETVQDVLKDVTKEFAPVIKSSMELAKGPLKAFVKDLGKAFEELAPSIAPMMRAFTSLLGEIGPALPGIFESVGNSLTELFKTVIENKDTIAAMFLLVLHAIPPVIDTIGWLTRAFGAVIDVAITVGDVISLAFQQVKIIMASVVEAIAIGARTLGELLSNIPGMEDFGKSIVHGADVVIGKMREIKSEAERTKVDIQIGADIRVLQRNLDEARAELADPNLTKERRATLNADISKLMVAQATAVSKLSDPKLIKEYVAKLTADGTKLANELASAKKSLADPNLTKERRAKLNADIAQLKSQIAAAKAAIATVQGKTVTVFVKTEYQSDLSRAALRGAAKASGGISGAAGGGPRSNMTLVGEQGPELVRLPFGSSVTSAGQTRAKLAGMGGGDGVTVNVYVQGSIRSDRDLVKIIRDEFVNGGFRGALSNT